MPSRELVGSGVKPGPGGAGLAHMPQLDALLAFIVSCPSWGGANQHLEPEGSLYCIARGASFSRVCG